MVGVPDDLLVDNPQTMRVVSDNIANYKGLDPDKVRVKINLAVPVASSFGVLTSERGSRIQALDLDFAKKRLMKEGWTEARCDEAIKWYRRFLDIITKYPGFNFVPGTDVDEVWHQHVLSTRRYARDCEHVLGFFLHHEPLDSSKDVDKHKVNVGYQTTHRLYMKEYNGEVPPFQPSWCDKPSCDNTCYSGD